MSGPPKTPGVYINERDAFPNTIVPVPTSTTAFIGYTEKHAYSGKELLHKPFCIGSFSEFMSVFGGAPKTTFNIEATENDPGFVLSRSSAPHLLFYAVMLFYQNGGGNCFIISVGDYDKAFDKGDFTGALGDETPRGLMALEGEVDPAIVVVPEAILFSKEECAEIQKAMLKHCAAEGRFAILDVHDGHMERNSNQPEQDVINLFRANIGSDHLRFGAAYYPWLHTSLVSSYDITFENIDKGSREDLREILQEQVKDHADLQAEVAKLSEENVDANQLHKNLIVTIQIYKDIIAAMAKEINALPPSGAMAGVYANVDHARGVHKAPANVSVSSVNAPIVAIGHEAQEDLNVPTDGKSVNAIRSFIGEGTLVWGARTLDGNSLDWRYVNVRRLVTMIEKSVSLGLRAFVFEPNDANTWTTVKASIDNFLYGLWKEGALAGASPNDAFNVAVGLGSTMTEQDILAGLIRVSIKIAATHPAEFIVLDFQQEMGRS